MGGAIELIKAAVDNVFLHHLETGERGSACVMADGTPLTGLKARDHCRSPELSHDVGVNLRNLRR